jgi:hypothetical protein
MKLGTNAFESPKSNSKFGSLFKLGLKRQLDDKNLEETAKEYQDENDHPNYKDKVTLLTNRHTEGGIS